ncbi:MAG TPA: LamG-like jellyroll fold domain-containing protein, partial [Aggregatilineales bacterium]|nr:LamG-like jellyroll fold domain-containing protein [Aggregatilineales bacterium]
VNGTAVATTQVPSGLIDVGPNPMTIGRKSSASSDFFSGSIDEVAVYDRALAASDILARYSIASGVTATATPTLTATSSLPTTTPGGLTPTPTAPSTPTPTPTPNTQHYAQMVSSDGPVSWWRLGEASGTIAADSADGNNGTITGGVTLGAPGAIAGDPNTAMTFDGSTGYINIPFSSNLDIANDLTLEAWANPQSLSGNPTSVAEKGVYNYRIGTVNNHWRGSIFFSGVLYDVISPGAAVAGQWAYIVLTRQGTTLTLYVNGAAVATTQVPSGLMDTGANPMTIGRKSSASSDFFGGSIDEVAVYNTALSASRIQARYNVATQGAAPTPTPTLVSPTAKQPLTPTATVAATVTPTLTSTASIVSTYAQTILADGPISYWRLGEKSGTTALDSADTNNGTTTGGVTPGVPGAIANDPDTAMTFDGTTGYISILDKANLDIRGDLTIEGWANPALLNGLPETIANKGYYQYRLGLNNNHWRGSVFFKGVASNVISPSAATISQWTYIAMTRLGTSLTLYVNGTAVASATISNGQIDTSTVIFAIGRKSSSAADFFNGSLDEVAVYNKALSPARIMAHYQAGLPATATATPTQTPTLAPTFQPPTP